MTVVRSKHGGGGQATAGDARRIAKATAEASVAQLGTRLADLEKGIAAKRQARQEGLNGAARQLIELHKRLAAIEVDRGIRAALPVIKTDASLLEQLRASVNDTPGRIRKNGGPVSWEGFF